MAKLNTFSPMEVEWSRRILERCKVRTARRLSRSAYQQMDVSVALDYISQSLVYSLDTELLREKLLEDTQDVPFRAEVPVSVPPRPVRTSAITGFVLAITMTAIAIIVGSVVFAGAAVAMALMAVTTLVEPLYPTATIAKIEGTVQVRASYFHAFPENTVPLPPEYGSPYRLVELDVPTCSLTA